MTHKQIKKFGIDGESDTVESAVKLRPWIESLLDEQMRDKGYVPVLDIAPAFSTEYTIQNTFKWVVTIHGVYVGKVKAWQIEGIEKGREVKKYTLPATSKQS
jgi:hypothetical protein